MVYLFISLIALGAGLSIWGFIFSIYPKSIRKLIEDREGKRQQLLSIFLRFEKFICPSSKSEVYKLLSKFIEKMNIEMSVERMHILKWVSLVLGAVLTVCVSYTNLELNKENIIGSWWKNTSLGESLTTEDFKYNARLYRVVVADIGQKKMKGLDREGRLREMQSKLTKYDVGITDSKEKAKAMLTTYERYENERVIDVKIVFIMLSFFFFPELIILIRKIIIGRKYKLEAIKMENVFELLAGIKDFKTSLILNEMIKVSSVNKKQLEKAVGIFNVDKMEGLNCIKKAIPDARFYDLVDAIRVYSTVDKNVALQILERSRREKEEKQLLTAEEDMDVVDVIAFISIVPILYELCNMMIKPMLDLVFKTFNYL